VNLAAKVTKKNQTYVIKSEKLTFVVHLFIVSHSCLNDIDYVVAQFFTLVDDIHVYRSNSIGIGMVVDVVDVL
jgi:hypothetical protein